MLTYLTKSTYSIDKALNRLKHGTIPTITVRSGGGRWVGVSKEVGMLGDIVIFISRRKIMTFDEY